MPVGRRRGQATPLTDVDRERIVRARRNRGWSVAQLAERVGLHQSTVYRLENGTLRATPRLAAMYRVLELPVEQIGKPDPDEEELLALYRELKRHEPAEASQLLSQARQRAHRERPSAAPRWFAIDGLVPRL